MPSKLVTEARAFLARCRPRPCGYAFDPHRPFGLVTGDRGENLLNLGVGGAWTLIRCFGEITAQDIDALVVESWDRQEFSRWVIGLKHGFDRTLPGSAEQRALKALDERANADLYRRMGLPVPPR